MNTEHRYTKQQVIDLLEACLEKTLGEIDKNHVFDRTKTNPKITGIAGDVIEQSVFGYPANSDSSPDLIIDDVPTELKTTGIKYSHDISTDNFSKFYVEEYLDDIKSFLEIAKNAVDKKHNSLDTTTKEN